MKKILTFCLLLSQIITHSQEINPQIDCASDEINKQLILNPEIAAKMASYEAAVKNRSLTAKTTTTTYKIPVVVHVMHKGEAIGVGTNISDDVINAKMKAINEQYRKIPGSKGDGSGVDMEIEFVLAVRDPQGNQTNGIDRYNMSNQSAYITYGINSGLNSSYTSGISEANLKALAFWDSTKYYNIWVVSEVDNNNGGSGIQGAAQPPAKHGTALDGFYITSNSFKDPLGRMETHELGHAFALYHTFQGDLDTNGNSICPTSDPAQGDFCADTAPHKRATSGDCSVTTNACYPTNPDLGYLHNYMNYTLDGCRDMFTADQKNRAITALTTLRASFLSSSSTDNLKPVATPIAGFLPSQPVVITAGSSLELSDASTGVPTNYLNYYNWPGMTFNWNITNGSETLTSTDQNPILTFTTEGIYNVSHDVDNGIGTSSKTGNQLIYVTALATELPSTTLTSTKSGNYTINYVKFNTIEKTIIPTTNTVFADYINTDNTLLISGQTYNLNFNTKSGSPDVEWFAVYVDWNDNGNFEETEKLGTTSIPANSSLPRTVPVLVPTSCVKNKLLRLRISANARDAISNNMINGKDPFYIGDTKDFGLYIIDKPQLLGTDDFVANNVTVFPNPVNHVLNIDNNDTIEKIEIYNITGQLLISEKFQDSNAKMDLSELRSGTYIATIYSNGKRSSVKVLKN